MEVGLWAIIMHRIEMTKKKIIRLSHKFCVAKANWFMYEWTFSMNFNVRNKLSNDGIVYKVFYSKILSTNQNVYCLTQLPINRCVYIKCMLQCRSNDETQNNTRFILLAEEWLHLFYSNASLLLCDTSFFRYWEFNKMRNGSISIKIKYCVKFYFHILIKQITFMKIVLIRIDFLCWNFYWLNLIDKF